MQNTIEDLLNPLEPRRYAEGLLSLNTFAEMRASNKSKKKKKVSSVRNILNLYIKSSRKKRQVFMTTSHAPVHYYCHTASNIGQKSSTVYITTS